MICRAVTGNNAYWFSETRNFTKELLDDLGVTSAEFSIDQGSYENCLNPPNGITDCKFVATKANQRNVFCSIFGYANGTNSVSEINLENTNTDVAHLVCENEKCYGGQDPPCQEGVVRLECSNPNGVKYQFLEGTEKADKKTITGVLGVVWRSQLTILNLFKGVNQKYAKEMCGSLGFSSKDGSLKIEKSLKPTGGKLLIGTFVKNCPLGMDNQDCHSVREVDSSGNFFPYYLTCSFPIENLTFLREDIRISKGRVYFKIRAQYDVVYPNGNVRVVGSVSKGETEPKILCHAFGTTGSTGFSVKGDAISADNLKCDVGFRKEHMAEDCTYDLTNIGGDFNSTYSLLKCRNQSIVYWLKDGPIFKTPNFSIGTLMATITKKTSRETTPVNDQKGNGLLKNAMDQLGFDAVVAEQYYPFLPEYGFQSNTVLINAGFKESGIVYDGHSSSDEFLYVEFYNYPKVEESSLSYRLIGEDGAHSFYEGLLLVSFNTVDEEGRVKEVFGDGMVCQKSISVEVLERACEKMGFSKLLYHGSAAGYSSADSFNFTIGIGFKGLAFHYKTGNGDCVNKSEAIVVECGFDLAPNASFGNLTFNLVEESYSIPSDPLLASDWVPPRYRDPMAGYLLVTVSVLGNNIHWNGV
eukprot:sb/3462933/